MKTMFIADLLIFFGGLMLIYLGWTDSPGMMVGGAFLAGYWWHKIQQTATAAFKVNKLVRGCACGFVHKVGVCRLDEDDWDVDDEDTY